MTTGDGQARLARGTLSAEAIVEASLALLDAEGVAGFSMPRLGRELRASSTAVYRHFPSRDHIVLAVADHLVGESLDGFEPSADWVETLRDLALRFWTTCERHPAAAAMTHMRTTRRPNEMRAVEAIVSAILAGGWDGREALLHYRGFASFVLGVAGAGATFRSLPEQEQAGDASAWPQVYGHLDTQRFPGLAAVAPHLGEDVSAREVFERQVDLYLSALRAQAPAGR